MKENLSALGPNNVDLFRRLIAVLVLFGGLLIFGTIGYMILEGWAWHDAFYMTVITLSTVGFGEVRSLDQGGRVFTMILIVLGVGAAAYTFSTVADYIVAGELRGVLRRRRMEHRIRQFRQHYIVCGYGRVGSQVTQELRQHSVEMVVIEANPALSAEIEEQGTVSVIGNASEDATLSLAGIERAAGLCACLPNDADNVFVTLTARTLNPNLTIIARANTQENERKLRIAGADHVINPYSISGHRMARQLIHPNVVEFMDVVMRRGQVEIRIEEIRVSAGAALCAKSIAESDVRRRSGANVLAIRRSSGQTHVALDGDVILEAGDTLISLGTPEQLDALAALADDQRSGRR